MNGSAELLNNRLCMREPIPEIALAANLLSDAVDAHLSGKREAADRLIREADMPVLHEWVESLWGKKSPYVMSRKVENPLPHLGRAERYGSRMPGAALQRELLARDSYRCRFCGIPVIRSEVRAKLRTSYEDALRWTARSNLGCHAAFQVMWAQYDHVLPHSRGGRTEIDNLVITCAGCNFGRMEFTLDEVGLLDPRERVPMFADWDGLERIFCRAS